MRLNHRLSLLNVLLVFSLCPLAAQVDMTLQPGSVISIDGTSSLHSWTMTMEEGTSEGTATFTLDGQSLAGVENLHLTLPAESLKSGKPPLDANAYKALNTTENPNIEFAMKEVKSITPGSEGVKLEVVGDLTIAGSTQEVVLPSTCSVVGETVSCSGSLPIMMTTFGMEPPSVMLGTIKSGDEVVINYEVVWGK